MVTEIQNKFVSCDKISFVSTQFPDTYTQSEGGAEPPRPDSGNPNSNFNTRLEKIVDKNTKGKHVKVSNSGRFKEKKKVRASLAENPNLFDDREGKGQ